MTLKVCGGNRSPRGAATQQVVASVLRTAWQQQGDPLALLVALQCGPRPIVADLRMPGAAPPQPDDTLAVSQLVHNERPLEALSSYS